MSTDDTLNRALLERFARGEWLGPCQHGRDPYWRCEICDEAVEAFPVCVVCNRPERTGCCSEHDPT